MFGVKRSMSSAFQLDRLLSATLSSFLALVISSVLNVIEAALALNGIRLV